MVIIYSNFLFHSYLSYFINLYIFLEKHLFHLGFEIYQYSIAETMLSSTLNHPCQGSSRKESNRWIRPVAQPVENSVSLRPKGNRLDVAIRRLLFSVWWEGWKLDSKTGLSWGFGGKQCGRSFKKNVRVKGEKEWYTVQQRGKTRKGLLFQGKFQPAVGRELDEERK